MCSAFSSGTEDSAWCCVRLNASIRWRSRADENKSVLHDNNRSIIIITWSTYYCCIKIILLRIIIIYDTSIIFGRVSSSRNKRFSPRDKNPSSDYYFFFPSVLHSVLYKYGMILCIVWTKISCEKGSIFFAVVLYDPWMPQTRNSSTWRHRDWELKQAMLSRERIEESIPNLPYELRMNQITWRPGGDVKVLCLWVVLLLTGDEAVLILRLRPIGLNLILVNTKEVATNSDVPGNKNWVLRIIQHHIQNHKATANWYRIPITITDSPQ